MKTNSVIRDRIKKKTNGKTRIVIYGTGGATKELEPYFNELNMWDRIIAIVDRDTSESIGNEMYGYTIRKMDEVLDKCDLILIASRFYWREIESRLQAFFEIRGEKKDYFSVFNLEPETQRINLDAAKIEYVEYLEEDKKNISRNFVPDSPIDYVRTKDDPKIIAWYLPQYYVMDVNNKFHGKGFTEWTSASQGVPFYVGHQQPHIPYDVGYYNLTDIAVMKQQVELAKRYGVYGFCFHYYWFSGQRTMEKPVINFLEHKEIDFHYCLHWATENWTSVWDGGNYDLIYEQKTSEKDAELFVDDIIPFFQDERYIRINGKPLLMIYTVTMFKKKAWNSFVTKVKSLLRERGIEDIYIMITCFAGFDKDVSLYSADAFVEYPPSSVGNAPAKNIKGYLNPYLSIKIRI